jgi:hypothetical protein
MGSDYSSNSQLIINIFAVPWNTRYTMFINLFLGPFTFLFKILFLFFSIVLSFMAFVFCIIPHFYSICLKFIFIFFFIIVFLFPRI